MADTAVAPRMMSLGSALTYHADRDPHRPALTMGAGKVRRRLLREERENAPRDAYPNLR